MKRAIAETTRRRDRQREYNDEHSITPESIRKGLGELLSSDQAADYTGGLSVTDDKEEDFQTVAELVARIKQADDEMHKAAKELDFETAAELRDEIRKLRIQELALR